MPSCKQPKRCRDSKPTCETTSDLRPNDVLLGRGTGPNDNPGNIAFRDIIRNAFDEYSGAHVRGQKTAVARRIVATVHSNGGRFLQKRNDASKPSDQEAGNKAATGVDGGAESSQTASCTKLDEQNSNSADANADDENVGKHKATYMIISNQSKLIQKTKQAFRFIQRKDNHGTQAQSHGPAQATAQIATEPSRLAKLVDDTPPGTASSTSLPWDGQAVSVVSAPSPVPGASSNINELTSLATAAMQLLSQSNGLTSAASTNPPITIHRAIAASGAPRNTNMNKTAASNNNGSNMNSSPSTDMATLINMVLDQSTQPPAARPAQAAQNEGLHLNHPQAQASAENIINTARMGSSEFNFSSFLSPSSSSSSPSASFLSSVPFGGSKLPCATAMVSGNHASSGASMGTDPLLSALLAQASMSPELGLALLLQRPGSKQPPSLAAPAVTAQAATTHATSQPAVLGGHAVPSPFPSQFDSGLGISSSAKLHSAGQNAPGISCAALHQHSNLIHDTIQGLGHFFQHPQQQQQQPQQQPSTGIHAAQGLFVQNQRSSNDVGTGDSSVSTILQAALQLTQPSPTLMGQSAAAFQQPGPASIPNTTSLLNNQTLAQEVVSQILRGA